MSSLTDRLDQFFYPHQGENWDDSLFRERILRFLSPHFVILDIGAGAGIVRQMDFKGAAAKVCGIDLDPRVRDNPMLDEGRVADICQIPYDDQQFDLVYADNVLEHLADPLAVLREVRRVLKPGGRFLFKTPNTTHYMPTIARLTPHRFHQFVNRLRGRAEEDTFPTLYRANSRAQIARLADDAGLLIETLERVEGRPEYLRMTWVTYVIGIAYERIVSANDLLSVFRILLIGVLRKPQ